MHQNVICVTLNPSIDVSLIVDGLHCSHPNRILKEHREMGGSGVNVARVLNSFGRETLSVSIVGEDNSEEFGGYLEDEYLRYEFIKVPGSVRENMIFYGDSDVMTFNRRGPSVSVIMIGAMMELIRRRTKKGDIVVFAGSLPDNIAVSDYTELLMAVKQLGALVAVNSDVLTLEDYAKISPWMIKMNSERLSELTGFDGENLDDLAESAKRLESCCTENVLVTFGVNGLVCLSNGEVIKAKVPRVDIKSSVGAGDAVVAGFISGFVKDKPLEESVKIAAACGTASIIKEGTLVATKKESMHIIDKIEII